MRISCKVAFNKCPPRYLSSPENMGSHIPSWKAPPIPPAVPRAQKKKEKEEGEEVSLNGAIKQEGGGGRNRGSDPPLLLPIESHLGTSYSLILGRAF